MHKKIIVIMFAVALAISVSACKNRYNIETTDSTSTSVEANTEETDFAVTENSEAHETESISEMETMNDMETEIETTEAETTEVPDTVQQETEKTDYNCGGGSDDWSGGEF